MMLMTEDVLKTLFSAFLSNSYKPNYDLDYILQQFTALL